MVAVDTNVVVRFLVSDEAAQSRRAAKLFQTEPVWLSKTVILECEWVLRGVYQFTSAEIAKALRALLGLANVDVEDAPAVAGALNAMSQGLDFADALHAASAGPGKRLLTFDVKFAKRAPDAGMDWVELL